MLKVASVLPAGPGERDNDAFPIRERLRFRDNLGLGLREVRQRPPFAALARGPWHVFIAIACYWQANAEAWPSQETIAGFSGYSSRAVRDYVDVLERVGIVRLRRERRPNGADRIYYAPGLVTLIELAAFVERFPRGPVKASPSHPPERPSGSPPEAVSAAPPEAASGERRDQDQEPSSCPSVTATPREPEPEEEQPMVTKVDREIARVALAERMKRKHPERPPPRWYDRADVEMVARCTAAVEGDRETKLAANRAAIDGALCASKEGAPTARFIWAKLEHFLDHVERGSRKAAAEARDVERRTDQDRQVASESGAGVARLGHAAPERLSLAELAKTRAEFEQLVAAHAGSPFCQYLESMTARYRRLEEKATR
jgi:Helix-turn-helix domain